MLTACRGEVCYLRIPGICIGGTETVVPAHSNEQAHGKGMGIKADDKYTVPACYACHFVIDQSAMLTKQEKFSFWRDAYAAWQPVRDNKLNVKTATLTVDKTTATSTGLHSLGGRTATPKKEVAA